MLGRKIQKRTLVPGRDLNELKGKQIQAIAPYEHWIPVCQTVWWCRTLPAILTPYDEARRYKGWGICTTTWT